jgi:aquaporin TIP
MSISGGQFNPAVTLGLLVGRKITPTQAAINWVFQIVGGILGGFLAKASLGGASIAGGIPNAGGISTGQGILIEAIATFFLVTVVYGTAVDPRFGGRLGGLAIGLTIGADILAVGPLTGASMNTARWLGPAIAEGTFPTPAVHLLGPLVGAAVAGALYAYVLLDEPRPHPEPQAQMRAKGNL